MAGGDGKHGIGLVMASDLPATVVYQSKEYKTTGRQAVNRTTTMIELVPMDFDAKDNVAIWVRLCDTFIIQQEEKP